MDPGPGLNSDLRTGVVLATYNGAHFLRKQLDSILAQTVLPDVLVARDDASSDDEATWRILERYQPLFESRGIQVELERGFDNLGYRGNFERLLKRVSADIIFLCDQDDVWHTEKIERMLNEFRQRPNLGLLFTDARLVDSAGKDMGARLFDAVRLGPDEVRMIHQGKIGHLLLRRSLVTGATVAMRAEAMRAVLPIPRGWSHDEWLAFAMAVRTSYELDVISDPLVDYRQHGGNTIGVTVPSAGFGVSRSLQRRHSEREIALRLQRLLHDHSFADGLSAHCLEEIQQRRMHAHHRGHLSDNRWVRLIAVIRETLSGRYSRYSLRWRSVVSDILLLD